MLLEAHTIEWVLEDNSGQIRLRRQNAHYGFWSLEKGKEPFLCLLKRIFHLLIPE